MTVLQLIDMLKACDTPNAEVTVIDVWGEGTFRITGAIYNLARVKLTGNRDRNFVA